LPELSGPPEVVFGASQNAPSCVWQQIRKEQSIFFRIAKFHFSNDFTSQKFPEIGQINHCQ
jgi:hypothetical protein